MNIAMFTNTYVPHVGGVAQSICRFEQMYRERGHRVLIVAPEYENVSENDTALRIPAIQNFNGSDFSMALPVPVRLRHTLEKFNPHIIHSHHPFLLGDPALRVSAALEVPIVFTHHTMYERYLHYVPIEVPEMGKIVIAIATQYANMCDQVIAPSESIRDILLERGVRKPIAVIPTGVDIHKYQEGNGAAARDRYGIPQDAFVIGHVGRLAKEKNLRFLARAIAECLNRTPNTHALIVGGGVEQEPLERLFDTAALGRRVTFAGPLQDQALIDAYHAMDLFAFSSHNETQGMVLVEAMAAGKPVVGLDAPGSRDVIEDGANGTLVMNESVEAFAAALNTYVRMDSGEYEQFAGHARETAEAHSCESCAEKCLSLYEEVIERKRGEHHFDEPVWASLLRSAKETWELWTKRVEATADVFRE